MDTFYEEFRALTQKHFGKKMKMADIIKLLSQQNMIDIREIDIAKYLTLDEIFRHCFDSYCCIAEGYDGLTLRIIDMCKKEDDYVRLIMSMVNFQYGDKKYIAENRQYLKERIPNYDEYEKIAYHKSQSCHVIATMNNKIYNIPHNLEYVCDQFTIANKIVTLPDGTYVGIINKHDIPCVLQIGPITFTFKSDYEYFLQEMLVAQVDSPFSDELAGKV